MITRKTVRKLPLILFAVAALAGCNIGIQAEDEQEAVAVTGVILDQETLALTIHDSFQLAAVITPENATNQNISWSSNPASVAQVDQNGLVTALAEGSAVITITTEDSDHTDSCMVTVAAVPVAVTAVTLDRESLALDIDESFQLTAVLTPENATNRNISWSSEPASVAQVDQNGLVTALTEGSAVITITTEDGDHTDSCTVTVTPIDVTGVTLNRDTLALAINDSFQLTATIAPEIATNKNLSWTSDAASVAAVNQNGLVTALAEGSAVITVTTHDGGHTDSFTVTVYSEDAFVTVWDLSLSTVPTPTLLIPLHSTGNYDFTIDWGDGTVETYSGLVHNDVDHEYTDRGVYTVVITGTCEGFGSGPTGVPSDDALVDILRWGEVKLHNEGYQLAYCTNLATISAPDIPDLSGVTNLSWMFHQCQTLNADLSGWDTSGVTTMFRMFNSAFAFNGDIGSWNTGMVTNMSGMFRGALNFNQNLSGWNTASVTDMSQMFYDARAFNGNISTWNTGIVSTMNNMFRAASAFNTDISGWNTTQVEDMSFMFSAATSFNINISGWDTSSVTNMARMFEDAISFNQNLDWDTSGVTNMEYMFDSTAAFNGDISGWNTGQVTDMSYMFFMAQSFNSDISGWNTGNVESMTYMFRRAELFNQDLSLWNTGNVTSMSNMFNGAAAFNSDLSGWNVSSVTDMNMMFRTASSFTNGGNPQGLNGWTINASCTTTDMFDFCPLNPLPDWY